MIDKDMHELKKLGGLIAGVIIVSIIAFAMGRADATEPHQTTTPGAQSNADADARSRSVSVGVGGTAHARADGGNAVASGGRSSASVGNVSGGNASAEGGRGGRSSATQQQQQSAHGGNGGAGGDGGSANNEGNAQSTTIATAYEDRLQAPSTFAAAVYASGPCAYGWSAALSVPGGSIGGGRAKADPSCDRREVARVLTPLNPQLALKVLCADPIVKSVASEADCGLPISALNKTTESFNKPPDSRNESAPACNESHPTRNEVSEQISRAFEKCQAK